MSSIKRGSVRSWFPERNFGFISETGTSIEAFMHASALEFDRELVRIGMLVEYEVVARKYKGGEGFGAINVRLRPNPSKAADILATPRDYAQASAQPSSEAVRTTLAQDTHSADTVNVQNADAAQQNSDSRRGQ
jgi:cold shock CspA family protein